MADSTGALTITHEEADERYMVDIDGHEAELVYMLKGNVITYIHTYVPEELEGRGIASQLAARALSDARERGYRVVARCPYVAHYMGRHPEYDDLRAR